MSNKIIRKKGLVFQEVDGIIHILDEKNDAIITLNQSASLLWKKLIKPLSLEDLAIILVSEYNIKLSKATEDCKELIEKLDRYNLLSKAK